MGTCGNCGQEGEQGADGARGLNWIDDSWVCNECMTKHVGRGGSTFTSPVHDTGEY